MPSSNYALFVQSMRQRKQITCRYGGYRREICSIVLGHRKSGEEVALTFQFAGETSSRLPRGGAWRCLFLTEATDVELRDGPWHAGTSHNQPQS